MATDVDTVLPIIQSLNIEPDHEAEKLSPTLPSTNDHNPPTDDHNQHNETPKAMTVKHPLMHRWVLWYCKQDRDKAWEDCMKEVAAFNTVEDFWALYNHIQLASGLTWLSDYYLFKEGIQPMWEDENNREGGRWLIQVDKSRRSDFLDTYWLELLMAMIGEQFGDCSEYVCGAVVNVRQKGDKISLWTKDESKESVNRKIGKILKDKLGVKVTITYESHREVSQKTNSNVKPQMRL